jgi:outer membrane protein assembly factor BamD
MRLSLVIFLVLLLVAGCASTKKIGKGTADEQYELARKLYERGKYTDAEEAFRLLVFNHSGVSYIDSVQYFLGMCYFDDEYYILAVSEFRRLVKNFPHSTLADDGQLMIGKSYYLSAPGNVGLDQSDTYTAVTELENFIEDYPQSPLIDEATSLLRECKSKIAHKIYKSGEQYYKMGMKTAARVYLEEVVTDFESPEWRGCALYLLAKIDQSEDKLEDSEAKLTNLLREFPHHKWERKAENLLEDVRDDLGRSSSASSDL